MKPSWINPFHIYFFFLTSLSALPPDFQLEDVIVAVFEVPRSPACASEQQMAPLSGELGRQGDGDV